MIGTIRKHQQWLWAVIITVTIISFVWYFGPSSKMSDVRGGPRKIGAINGEPISKENLKNAFHEVELLYFFMSGGRGWPSEDSKKMGFDPDAESYKWLLLIQKQEQLGIHPSSDAVAQLATDMLRQLSGGGNVSSAAFEQQILRPHNLELSDFERFVRHYLGRQELIATAGVSGKLVTPQEAKGLYERERQEVSAEAVLFSASNYVSQVTAAPEAISQFYSNQLANYRLPERRQVSYVKFGISNFLAEAEAELMKTNLTQIVENNFTRMGTNYARFGKTPEEAKAKIREEIIRESAMLKARRKAADFAGPLFANEPLRAENLEKLAKTNGLTVEVTAPFDRDASPKDLDVGADFRKQAFARRPEDPFAPPIVGRDGVYVMAFNKIIPGEIPPLDKIREQVTQDYKRNQAIALARKAGAVFYQTVTNGITQGKTFAAICTEAKIKPIELPPFSLSTRELPTLEDHVTINQLKELAFRTQPGKVGDFEETREGGILLYVKARLPLDQTKMQAELPAFVNYVRQRRQEEAFEAWFRKEADRGLRETPLARPQQQQAPPPAAGKS